MMNSVKSARLNLVKFLFLLPLLIVLLLSFRQAQTRHSEHKTAVAAVQSTDTLPPPPPPPPQPPVKKVDAKIKTPPPPPKQPKVSDADVSADDSDEQEAHVAISTKPVVKTVTSVKVITKIEPKVETLATIKTDMQTTAIAKVAVSDLKTTVKPVLSTLSDIKPVTSVMTANVMTATESGAEEVLVLKNTTTKADLEQMKKDLESKGFEVTIKDVTYSDDKVVTIKGTIRKGEAWGSFESAHFQKFVVSYVPGKDSRFLVSVLHGSIVFTNNAE